MRIHHQSFGGRCIFCGARTQDTYSLQPDPIEIPPDILWRPGSSAGKGSGKPQPEAFLKEVPAGRIRAQPAPIGTSRIPDAGVMAIPASWRPAAGPIVEDPYDDCPKARMVTILFFVLFMLPMAFFLFGWQVFSAGIGLGGYFFRNVLTLENEKWYGLRDVQEEYASLMATASSNNRNYYHMLLGSAMSSLFSLRDRAFKARSMILGESFEEIDFKIQCLESKARNQEDPDLLAMYRSQLKDLKENRKKIEQISALLEKFEASKNCLVESVKLLKNRILLTETHGDQAEEERIQEDLKLLHRVYERVNNPAPKREIERETSIRLAGETSPSPESPAPIRRLGVG